MKTVCVMDSVSRANGGIFEAERKLQRNLLAQGSVEIEVLGLRDAHTDADHAAWHPLQPVTLPVTGPHAFGYASGFASSLGTIDPELVYSVGLWKAPSLEVLRWARRTGRPYLVAPHGMLDPWAVRNSGLKKKVAGWLFQNAQLQRAACIRALCQNEADSIRAYGLRNPVCVIPNGIDLPSEVETRPRPAFFPTDKKVLLYLGRLHPKKGLSPLLAAWKNVGAHGRDWVLVVAGWDQSGHEAELKRQAAALSLDDSVIFPGPQFGPAREACYAACDAFVLPSLSEGLPMVVLEAWAYGKPVLMTPACNLPEGFAATAALRVEPNPESLATGLEHLFRLSRGELERMGERGRILVREQFAWTRLATEMAAVYSWILGRGEQPACVQSF